MTSLTRTGVWGRMGAPLGRGEVTLDAVLCYNQSRSTTSAPVASVTSPQRTLPDTGAVLCSGDVQKSPRGVPPPEGMAQRVRTHMSTHSIAADGWRVPTNRRRA